MSRPTVSPALRPLGERLLSGASWALIGRLLALPAGLLSTMLLARLLSPADLGAYFLAFSLANLLAIIAQLGLGRPMIKLIARALAEDRPAAARHAVKVGVTVTLVCGGLLAVGLAGGPGRAVAGLLQDGQRLRDVLPLVALLVPAFALIDLCAESLRGFHDLRANSMLGELLVHRLLLMAALLVMWLMGWPGTLSDVLLISVATAGLVTAVGMILLAGHVRALDRSGVRPRTAEVLRHAPDFLLIRINFWLMASADLWVLGMYRTPEEVALYGAAYRIAGLVGIPMLVGNAVLAPVISELHAMGQLLRLERVVRGSATVGLLPALILVILFAFQGEPILALIYTSAYGGAHLVLLILALARLAHVGAGACGLSLTMTGHQRDVMRVGVANSLLTVLAYVLVVPSQGALGAALVTAVSVILHNVVLASLARRRLGVRTWASLSPAGPRDLRMLLTRARRAGSERGGQ